MSRTFSPGELSDALRFLESNPATVVAGGTDVYPAHVERPVQGALLDIGGIDALRNIDLVEANGVPCLEIGAAVTWSSLVRRESGLLKHPLLDCLAMAGAEVGGIQIQNRGTIAGNLCNASPAADGVPALMALDAQVVLSSSGGERTLPLTEFITGPRQTLLAADELVRAIQVPWPTNDSGSCHSAFLKLGHRRYLVISAVMVAARLDWAGNRISHAAIAVGSCGPVASRLAALETELVGLDAGQVTALLQTPLADKYFSALSPITDARGSANYRLHGAAVVTRRALGMLAGATGGLVGQGLSSFNPGNQTATGH